MAGLPNIEERSGFVRRVVNQNNVEELLTIGYRPVCVPLKIPVGGGREDMVMEIPDAIYAERQRVMQLGISLQEYRQFGILQADLEGFAKQRIQRWVAETSIFKLLSIKLASFWRKVLSACKHL